MTVTTVYRNGNGEMGRPTIRKIINGNEVSLTAWNILERLRANPGVKAAELARSLKLTKARVYQCLRELEAAGLVSKRSGYSVEG